MVGNVSAAIDLVQFHSALCEQLVADQNVGAMRIAAEGQHGRMFQQEQRVANKLLLPCSDDLLLDGHGFRIRDAAEMEEVDVHCRLCFVFLLQGRKQPNMGARLFL